MFFSCLNFALSLSFSLRIIAAREQHTFFSHEFFYFKYTWAIFEYLPQKKFMGKMKRFCLSADTLNHKFQLQS